MTDDIFDSAEDEFDSAETFGDPRVIEGNSSRTMPHPLTGKMTKFPRASTFAGTLSDDYILTEWKIAMAVMGVAKTRGLWAMANAEPLPEANMEDREKGWWTPWKEIGHKGMDAAGSQNGAHLGTAFHKWGERIDLGEITPMDVPPEWRAHALAYVKAHEDAGMSIVREYVETIVLNLSLGKGVVGRLDGLRRMGDGSLMVDDTKTGRQAPMGVDEIAIQEAVYAGAEWHWSGGDTLNHGWVPAPAEVRKDIATITWVPINAPENTEVIPLDLAHPVYGGMVAAETAAWVRQYRNAAKRKPGNGIRLPYSALSALNLCTCTRAPEPHDPDWHGGRERALWG